MDFKDYLYYDENSPTKLRWKVDRRAGKNASMVIAKAGSPAGGRNRERCVVSINTIKYKIHRVIWSIFNGDIPEGYVIDHVDKNPWNNEISNLRCVTQQINARNRPKTKNNTSGFTGISFHRWSRGKYSYDYWVATWEVDGKTYSKRFSISKLGSDAAKISAFEYRKSIIKDLELTQGYLAGHGE